MLLGDFFGPLAGNLLNQFVVGPQFGKFGMRSPMSGVVLPSNGMTYSGAYQNMLNSMDSKYQSYRTAQRAKTLRKEFMRDYYRVLHGSDTPQDKIDSWVQDNINTAISGAGLFSLLLDPYQVQQQAAGIEGSAAGALKWARQRDPLTITSGKAAKAISDVVTQASVQAGRAGRPGESANYGGLTPAAVAQLASIMSNTADVMGPANGDLKAASQKFKKRLQETSRALQSLRDVFGQDVSKMVNMLQDVSGQNIMQLRPQTIRAISQRAVDMARFSGMDINQMSMMGSSLRNMLAANGANNFAQIGAAGLGIQSAALMAPGANAYGIHDRTYQAQALNRMASAQGSEGTQYLAMAYGLWQQQNKGGSVNDFARLVQSRMGRGKDALSVALQLTGKKTVADLMQGSVTDGYSRALMQGRLGSVGVRQNYNNFVRQAVRGSSMLHLFRKGGKFELSDKDLTQIQQVLTGTQYTEDLAQFSKTGELTDGLKKRLSTNQQNMLMFLRNNTNGQFMGRLRQVTQLEQAQRFSEGQARIRKEMQALNIAPADGARILTKALMGQWDSKSGLPKELSRSQMQAFKLMAGHIFQDIGVNAQELRKSQKAFNTLVQTDFKAAQGQSQQSLQKVKNLLSDPSNHMDLIQFSKTGELSQRLKSRLTPEQQASLQQLRTNQKFKGALERIDTIATSGDRRFKQYAANFKANVGDTETAASAWSYALYGQGREDSKLLKHVKTLSSTTATEKQMQAARSYVYSTMATGHQDKALQAFAAEHAANKENRQALENAMRGSDQKAKKKAIQTYQEKTKQAYALHKAGDSKFRLSTMQGKQFTAKQREAFKQFMQLRYRKEGGQYTDQQLKKKYGAEYDKQKQALKAAGLSDSDVRLAQAAIQGGGNSKMQYILLELTATMKALVSKLFKTPDKQPDK